VSAQIIDALRKRADKLEAAVTPELPVVSTDLADDRPPSRRAVQNMIRRALAAELVAVADEAEGRERFAARFPQERP
jgi:hypothetical protein